jgi:cell wall-associated NlpC family hydrolase
LNLRIDDHRVLRMLEAWGVPYAWAGGSPATKWPPPPVDCSGFVQAALVELGTLHPSQPDRTAEGLRGVCDPVEPDAAELGDLAFYGRSKATHVVLCLGGGVTLGANGGGRATAGDDPRAFVQLQPLRYRADLLGVGRPQFRHLAHPRK